MFNFGVIEVANTSSSAAPGWAYVPDRGVHASVTALQPSARKRPRTQIGSSTHDTTAKQDAKTARDLAALDRENHKDVSIPVPVRHRDNAGRVSHGKVTPAVRKILQSAKTFANHLADYQALLDQTSNSNNPTPARPGTSTPVASAQRSAGGTPTPSLSTKRPYKKRDQKNTPSSASSRRISTALQESTSATTGDTPMTDAPILSIGSSTTPAPHPGDNESLLVSRVPAMPTQEEIQKLLAAPPMSYMDARGPWVEADRKKPLRKFCDVCGYWGRVKCKTCGSRVCALECLSIHSEDCFTKYGA